MQKNQYKIMYELEDMHWWFVAKRRFINTLLPRKKGKMQILDVGSGTGGTTKFLQNYGKVTSIEQSKYAHPFLKKRQIKFIPKSIINCNLPSEKFDLIFVLDVLYHQNIVDDQKVLSKLYKALKKGGYICITDCAIPQLLSHHDKVMEARVRYTKKELERKLSQSNFKVVRSSFIYFFLFPLFFLSRLLDKVVPLDTMGKPNAAVNRILIGICSFEAMMLSKHSLPIGSSLIIVAKKI